MSLKINIDKVLILIFTLVIIGEIEAQPHAKALNMLDDRGEILIKFEKPVANSLQELSNIMSIDKVADNKGIYDVYAYLNKKQYNQFKAKNIDFELLSPPSLKAFTMCPDLGSVKNWDCYPTYDQYVSLLESFQANFPNLCQLVEYGQSIEGRKLLAVKLSDNVSVKEEEPEFLFTSSIHGDETTGYVLMLRLIDYLLTNFATNQQISDLLMHTEIWINPLSNPDGTYYLSNSNIFGARRGNSNAIDLNRNFPCYYPQPLDFIDQHPDENAWQLENIKMMDFLKSHNFVLSANFHGGAEVVNYPWDVCNSSEKLHPDNDLYYQISKDYADTVHFNSSGYMIDLDGSPNPSGITNGGDWYEITGGRQDYVNYFMNSREVTIEISNVKMPDANLLPQYWNYNYRSFINYISRVHTGVYGKITDQYGKPLNVKVFITDHDSVKLNSCVYSDPTSGMYYRLLLPGIYHFTYTLEDHSAQELDLTVDLNSAIEQNIVLVKNPVGIAELDIKHKITNPFSNELQITMETLKSNIVEIKLFDLWGKEVLRQTESGISGADRIEIKTNSIKPGMYICTINDGFQTYKSKVIKID
jgi:hypothetical protein